MRRDFSLQERFSQGRFSGPGFLANIIEPTVADKKRGNRIPDEQACAIIANRVDLSERER